MINRGLELTFALSAHWNQNPLLINELGCITP